MNDTERCGCSLMNGRCEPHAAMMADIHAAWRSGNRIIAGMLWAIQDGYGHPGFMPCQGIDWSGIRDSSIPAIEHMHRVALLIAGG